MENELLTSRKPVVVINAEEVDPSLDSVVTDSKGNTQKMIQFLIDIGHQRIACVYNRSYHHPVPSANFLIRVAAYQETLQKNNLPVDPDLIVCFYHQKKVNDATLVDNNSFALYSNIEEDLAKFEALLSLPSPPTAIFCCGDEIAMYVYKLATRKGLKIPQDLTVVGYDDIIEAAIVKPGLTTVRTPLQEMGRLAVKRLGEKLIEQTKGINTSYKISLPGEIVLRDSHLKLK